MPPSNLCLSSYGLYHRLQYITSSFRKFLLCFFDIFRSFQAHRHIFLTAFRAPPGIKKSGHPYGYPDFLVREMGLEPTRRNHTHLKRACLPFQHSRKCHNIICFNTPFVNHYFPFSFPTQKKTHAVSAAWVLVNIGICGVINRPIQIGSIG